MPFHRLSFRPFIALLVGLWLGVGLVPAGIAQEEAESVEPTKFNSIEGSFFQIQDDSGYFWQAAANGALTSGETQYLQSGLNLIVDGSPFAPTSGEMVPPAADSSADITLALEEKRETMELDRAFWFDPARGGVRVIDSVRNTSGSALSVAIELRTTFPFGWQSLHGDSGDPLSMDPVLQLGSDDVGVLVHFSPAEGRHDTYILCGPGGSAPRAAILASGNRRELTLRYEIVVAPGETASLLHWILQAGLPDVEAVSTLTAGLIRNGELRNPGVDHSASATIVNFPPAAFPQPQSNPTRLRELLSLNAVLDPLGAQRRGVDTLWMSSTTPINGEISGSSAIEVDDIYRGRQSVPLTNVAAIRGAGTVSPFPRIFLRDGRVLFGRLEDADLFFTPEGTDSKQELSAAPYTLLLFRVAKEDGIPPEGTVGFVELIDGAVLTVSDTKGLEFSWRSLLGAESRDLAEISEIRHDPDPAPQFRIILKGGDRISGFLGGGTLVLQTAQGSPIEIPHAYLAAYREMGLRGWTEPSTETQWIGFEEIPGGWGTESGFLLAGNTLRSGTLGEEPLLWQGSESLLPVDPDQIAKIERLPTAGRIQFSLTLRSGEILTGRPAAAVLDVVMGDTYRQIPLEKFHAYRAKSS